MQCRAIRSISYALIIALVSALMPLPLSTPACAQRTQYAVAVVDFTNESGVMGEALARHATDATVVEMSKTDRYDVATTRSQIKKAYEDLGIHPPFDKVNYVRVGEKLEVDALLDGSIKSVQLMGTGATRRASVTLVVQMVDRASGEIINGAVQTGTSNTRVGYSPDDEALILEAANKAAFLAVRTMVDYVIPEATIQVNIGDDQVMLNRGVRDGIKPGMQMIILRAGEIIGFAEVREVNPTDSIAKVVKSMRGVQPEDKARAIFDMPVTGPVSKSAPMPSGAPAKSRGGSNGLKQIGKFLLGAGVVFGLVSLVRGGRGSESAVNLGTAGPMEIAWDPGKYGHGVNVLEYQIMRDSYTAGATPVKVLRDPSEIDAGKCSLAGLYGGTADLTFNYYSLLTNPATSYTSTSVTVPQEDYGTTHEYQVRVLYKVVPSISNSSSDNNNDNGDTTTGGNGTKYYYTPVSNVIRITATEPVGVNATDTVIPSGNASTGAFDLITPDLVNMDVPLFEWTTKTGADVYMVKVEPLIPGTAPSWQSGVVYATGPTAKLSYKDRENMAAKLGSYNEITFKWRVYSRHQADTSPSWVEGAEFLFTISNGPPTYNNN